MGRNKYHMVVDNIKNFLTTREKIGNGPRVVIQILETRKTEAEIREFEIYWKPLITKRDKIYIRPLLNWAGQICTEDIQVSEKGLRYPCLALWIAIAIDVDGNVYPCCEPVSTRGNSELLLGNIWKKSLREIYSETKIKDIRKSQLKGKFGIIDECSKCDFWSFYQNVFFKVGGRYF